ncbi:MAG: Ig-like domain repeat protein, partial [Bryocella sp.]
FVVDMKRSQVFELQAAGSWSVVAGSGVQGFSGDGGQATAARLNAPEGVAVGPDGALYIADTGNQRIRRVVGGVIATFAGTGVAGFSGDGAAATAAQLRKPTALAFDGDGNLLFADTGNQRVRRVVGGVLGTVAGNGVEGFSGDGGSALSAELDGPGGLVVLADGRILVADTHNHRVRSIDSSGVITTIAGTGVPGASGDGGTAVAGRLRSPHGLAANANGFYIADTENQRVRMVDALGQLSTIAGSGVQGHAADGVSAVAAMLDEPRALAAGPNGLVIVEAGSGIVQVLGGSGVLNAVVPAVAAGSSRVLLQAPSSATYGQGAATVSVSATTGTPTGSIALLEGGLVVGGGVLVGGSATVSLGALNVGQHTLIAEYGGDGFHASAGSNTVSATVIAAPVSVAPDDATMIYGNALPKFSGTTSGVLSRDVGSVSATYSTTATAQSSVGSYPITVGISGVGSGNYSVVIARSAQLTIAQASTSTVLSAVSGTSYAGLPLLLSASITSTSGGVPSGEVDFADNGVVVARSVVAGGVATATDLAPSSGAHTITASYLGDGNFAGSTSAMQAVAVAAMPDFTLSAGATSQTVQ